MTDKEVTIGRNEPCPCGSGKKYKRCCGVGAEPKLGTPKNPVAGLPPEAQEMLRSQGIDPSQIPTDGFAEMMKLFQKLPKAQARQLQSLMQRAMSGEDVSAEMSKLEKQLPPQFKEMMESMSGAEASTSPSSESMTEDEARKIVEQAIASGAISKEEADRELSHTDEKKKKSWLKSIFNKK